MKGKMMEIGKTTELFENPRHPYTQLLIGALPRVGDKTPREGIPGSPPPLRNPPPGCRFAPRCIYATEQCFGTAPELKDVGSGHMVACHRVAELNDLSET